jgi:hypothetical protein
MRYENYVYGVDRRQGIPIPRVRDDTDIPFLDEQACVADLGYLHALNNSSVFVK